MKITMYGAPICPDYVIAKEELMKRNDVELDYRNITETTAVLKEFLAYRDHEDMFQEVKDGGRIGIPFFILEDGTKTFEIEKFVDVDLTPAEPPVIACSLDGKGHCQEALEIGRRSRKAPGIPAEA